MNTLPLSDGRRPIGQTVAVGWVWSRAKAGEPDRPHRAGSELTAFPIVAGRLAGGPRSELLEGAKRRPSRSSPTGGPARASGAVLWKLVCCGRLRDRVGSEVSVEGLGERRVDDRRGHRRIWRCVHWGPRMPLAMTTSNEIPRSSIKASSAENEEAGKHSNCAYQQRRSAKRSTSIGFPGRAPGWLGGESHSRTTQAVSTPRPAEGNWRESGPSGRP
jgi:hypothetical protein